MMGINPIIGRYLGPMHVKGPHLYIGIMLTGNGKNFLANNMSGLDEDTLINLAQKYLWIPFLNFMDNLIYSIVPKETSNLRQRLHDSLTNSGTYTSVDTFDEFMISIDARKVPYSGVVDYMTTSEVRHSGHPISRRTGRPKWDEEAEGKYWQKLTMLGDGNIRRYYNNLIWKGLYKKLKPEANFLGKRPEVLARSLFTVRYI